MKIFLAQLNPTIGAFATNQKGVVAQVQQATREGADLVVFPELALGGYPPKDFLLKGDFVQRAQESLFELMPYSHDLGIIIGLPWQDGSSLFNAAAFLHEGKLVKLAYKRYLPNYSVFDEARYFYSGKEITYVDFCGHRLGLTICEDLWNCHDFFYPPRYENNLLTSFAGAGIDTMINIAASPYEQGKYGFRSRLLGHIASRYGWNMVFVNQVGAQDSLIFAGNSAVWDNQGVKRCELASMTEDAKLVEMASLDKGPALPQNIDSREQELERLYQALLLGISDYLAKTGIQRVMLGLSGGIDSALVAVLAAKALGPDRIQALLMPSPYSSEGSVTHAEKLCRNLGMGYDVLPIADLYSSYQKALHRVMQENELDVVHENVQARIRGNLLMAYANKDGALLLATSNRSETAVGYATLYGDMAGGLAPIADLPKTLVYELAEHINAHEGKKLIPQEILDKPPSAELRPDQLDKDSLPDYDVLDFILGQYIDELQAESAIAENVAVRFGWNREKSSSLVRRIVAKIHLAEYKRKQGAIVLKVGARDFTMGWRFPIVQGFA